MLSVKVTSNPDSDLFSLDILRSILYFFIFFYLYIADKTVLISGLTCGGIVLLLIMIALLFYIKRERSKFYLSTSSIPTLLLTENLILLID